MTPTNELRFVQRVDFEGKLCHVLQQKWEVEPVYDRLTGLPMPYRPASEWRDVPLAKEKP
jgi:hypothetical protein